MLRYRTKPVWAAGALLLGIIAIALHPHIDKHGTPATELRQMGALSTQDRLVHGTLLLLLGVLLVSCVRYALRRGLIYQPVMAGLVNFAVGVGSLLVAGLLDGFVTPEIVARTTASSEAAQVATVATLVACGVAVNVLTAFGIVAMAIAICAWSVDLASDTSQSRLAAIFGFSSAIFSVAVVVLSGSSLTPHALLAVVCAQGIWYVGLAMLPPRRQT